MLLLPLVTGEDGKGVGIGGVWRTIKEGMVHPAQEVGHVAVTGCRAQAAMMDDRERCVRSARASAPGMLCPIIVQSTQASSVLEGRQAGPGPPRRRTGRRYS